MDFRPKIESADGPGEWTAGFQVRGDGLCCDRCAAIVPKTPSTAARHREWCQKLAQVVERVHGG